MDVRSSALVVSLLAAGCSAEEPAFIDGEIGIYRHGLTVGGAGGCSTAIVNGLSKQLIAEQNCLRPNALQSFAGTPNISIGSAVNAFLEPPAVAALKKAVANKGATITINSALRTLAQQYLLKKWEGTCGIQIAASPGSSNHETGIALDVGNYSTYQSALEAQGWDWYGSGDLVHFDFRGAGAIDLRAESVRAFQRLWNVNNPGDKIAEDGDYGPATAARLAKTDVNGFAKGATCSTPTPTPPPPTPKPPTTVTGKYAAEYVDHGGPGALAAGETAELWVDFRNVGSETWTPDRTRLGTTAPRDRESPLYGGDWLSPSRPAAVEKETRPGEIGRFSFRVTAPETAQGLGFQESFALVEEGVSWFDEGTYQLELEVFAADARFQSLHAELKPQARGCSYGGAGEASTGALALALALLAMAVTRSWRRSLRAASPSGASRSPRRGTPAA
jgi:hypothetical protein